ncbi:DUF6493 family protein [Actinoplanes utahensis]|uniref:DUF7824 domain-containing protein n=1 Tax=Actinoplanes utahensis TaxID=1869 RepID=A0A0A6UG48_ACTUT|nr:DUF6493 family protein [Actinoplanes utahensis]KHD73269.1 hypothetical protein MB27_35565 [Actinoplanes utahensis]GIF27450.1 hypothetical protein Aut01nite_04360 [Actinoplanes utahensis]
MSLDWAVLLRRAVDADHSGVTALLLGAPEDERLGFFPQVEAGIKGLDDWWSGPSHPAAGLALAVVGTAPSAARAAALLTRRDLRDRWAWMPVDRLLAVAAAREVHWLGDLGVRLAGRLPTRDVWDGRDWEFVAALLRAGGTPPPATEGVVRGWLAGLIRPNGRRMPPLTTRLRDDEHLDLLLPAVFEIDGSGAQISSASVDENAVRFPEAVAALVAEGRLERKTVLAATVDRLVRGDKPNALRPFTLLHEALAPAVDEIAAHAVDYTRLLAEGPGPLATLAQPLLRTLGEAGRLDLDDLLEVSATVLLRREKTLVKAQLTWLEKTARREPDRAGEIYETISHAFGHPALDIQDRALTMIAKRLPRLAPETVARLAGAAEILAGDLPARAATIFGTVAPMTEPAGPPALPSPAGPALMPPPIGTPGELAEEIAALLHEPSGVRWERVLAGLVALHATTGEDALSAALTPLLERYPGRFHDDRWNPGSPFVRLGTAIRMATVRPRHDSTHQRLYREVRIAWQEGRRGGTGSALSSGPEGVLALRAAEIAVHINGSMMPELVATPTHVTGSIDPAVLLDRLTRAEAEGRQPWSFDLEQALLRLPRGAVDPAVTAGAAALTSPAGRQFAQWLASGGLPDPVSATFVHLGRKSTAGAYTWDRPVPRRVTATLRPCRDGGLRLERQLLTLTPPEHPIHTPGDVEGVEEVLAMVLPHHREVAAAWALGGLAALADQDQKGAGRLLPLLAECGGPVGPALAAGLAYAFGAKQESDRAAAVDAFLTLAAGPTAHGPGAAGGEPRVAGTGPGAAGGEPRVAGTGPGAAGGEPGGPAVAGGAPWVAGTGSFAAAAGVALGDLAADGTVKLSRVIPALDDVHRAGASAAVWELLAAALPPLLPTGQRAVPELLELATQVAAALGVRAPVAGLSEVAARPGSSRLVQESRRLRAVLTAPA